MAKGKNKPGRKGQKSAKRNRRLYDRATTNVELQDQSQVNLLQQQLQDAQRDYLRESQAAQSVWGGGGDAIAAMPRPQFDRIGDQYTQALGTLAGMFGGTAGMPTEEAAAGNGLGLAYGEAGQTMLANLDAREGMARSSAARQMDLSGRYTQDALIQRMEDAVRGYNDQLAQVRADDPWQIKSEVSDLRDRSLEQQLARQKMKSDQAFSDWLAGYLGGGSAGGGGGAHGGGGGGSKPVSSYHVNTNYGTKPGQQNPHVDPGHQINQYGGVGSAPYGPVDPGSPFKIEHPLTQYVHGGLRSIQDMNPARRAFIRSGIEKYASTHPDAFQRPDGGVHGPWNPQILPPRALIQNIEGRYYR